MPTIIGIPASGANLPYNTFTVYGFTNSSNIRALYGSFGYANILDDLTSTDVDEIMSQIIFDAEQTIIVRLNKFHTNSALLGSAWVKSRATWIAAHLLSKRRGNEHYFADLYEDALRELDGIASGEINPLVDIPTRDTIIPSMSNVYIDEMFISAKTRVRQNISVGGSYSGQDISFGYFWGWL
jgi:hypothetical protein